MGFVLMVYGGLRAEDLGCRVWGLGGLRFGVLGILGVGDSGFGV